MDLKSAVVRARRGLREEMRLYVVAVSSLTVAFLCLAGTLLAVTNLGIVAEQWGRSSRMSAYLAEGARPEDVVQLRTVLEGLREVERVDLVSSEEARRQFLAQSDLGADLSSLPVEAFPASLEITLVSGTPVQRSAAIAERIAQFRGVSDVETYRGFFARLESLLHTGRGVALALAVLVGLCVLAVISNTIRLAVARRQNEIEVMKLCGATDGFVRGPFMLEGIFQGFVSALLAVLVLMIGYVAMRSELDATFAALAGVRCRFLSPFLLLGLVFGGGLVGAMGSAFSVRRYLSV